MRFARILGSFVCAILFMFCALARLAVAVDDRQGMLDQFSTPPADCYPQTRWWWMGNALTKEEISWQLREMQSQGIRGVEQISMGPVYEKGNVPYLSDAFFDLLRHAVSEARRLDMTVSLNFGGEGWIWGGDWIPLEERNQNLLSSSMLIKGPVRVDTTLPTEATINPRDIPRSFRTIKAEDRLVTVVVGKLLNDVLDPKSLRVVTDCMKGRQLVWDAPEGSWRVMAFWSTLPDNSNAVNHIDKKAMTHYVDTLGEKYLAALGNDLGTKIESLFGDSFEVPIYRNGFYWCDSLPAEFRTRKGYDLFELLPALWWDVGTLSPKVRYDVNDVLHQMGMEAFFDTFTTWCKAHGVKSRVQPYGFVTDTLEGAGAVDIPETEITAGEKDAAPWFDTRIWPREYVASGAHLYGRNIVSAETYTYLHWEPYRATLEELKIASDMYLRAGVNRFNNHGFLASPERDIAPTRGFYPAIHISPDNVWWPYYHVLSDYIARSCYLLRQGTPCADVAIYSPTANQWTQDILNARKWTRNFEWGELGRLIISNGYAYDLVNDDALQRLSTPEGQTLQIGDMAYKVLLVPNIAAIPLKSLQRIEAYVAQGGVVIALERIPDTSCGMQNWEKEDQEVRDLASRLFKKPVGRDRQNHDVLTGKQSYGKGTTYWIERVMDRRDALDKHSSVLDPFLRVLRNHVTPDMTIDFVREDLRENDGLCFNHRKQDRRDIYFVTNVQDRPIEMPLGFRVTGAVPWQWNPYTGQSQALHVFQERDGLTWLPVRLAPYEATFLVFEKGEKRPHASSTSLTWIESMDEHGVKGWTDREGEHTVNMETGGCYRTNVELVPAPIAFPAPWQLILESPTFERMDMKLNELVSWTDLPQAMHFSGTGVYTLDFNLPKHYVRDNIRLYLDLGDVGNVAEVILNGKPVGIVWMKGQRLEVTKQALGGKNHIEIRVTNTLINRVSGLKEFPPVPKELQPRLGHGLTDTGSSAQALLGFKPLPRSGLLGPVEIHPYKHVSITLDPKHVQK